MTQILFFLFVKMTGKINLKGFVKGSRIVNEYFTIGFKKLNSKNLNTTYTRKSIESKLEITEDIKDTMKLLRNI